MVAAAVLLCAASGAEDPGLALAPGGGEREWKPLIDALAAKGTVVAPFTERRYFPFRHDPTVLGGTIRMSRERGLSLQYTAPQASVMVADSQGIILRDGEGHQRELQSGSHGTGGLAALLPIMRFDFAALYPAFVITARGSSDAWTFDFLPRDPEVARSLGEILIGGTGTDVHRLEFRRSASQRVEIDVGETRSGTPFTPAELRQFFR